MFESHRRLKEEIERLLEVLRELGQGRYACVMDPSGILFDSAPDEGEPAWMLRQFLKEHAATLFTLPGAMEADGPGQDIFADWSQDEFFLAFVNRRVALVVACPHAEGLRESASRPLKVLADRLLRYNQAWRVGPQGQGGFFFGRAQLDVVVVGKEEATS